MSLTCARRGPVGTAIQHGCRVLLVVIDNGLLGRVEHGFKNAKGCEITGCDWVALARAYGADGMHVARDSEIEAALDAGLSAFVLRERGAFEPLPFPVPVLDITRNFGGATIEATPPPSRE